MSQGLVTVSKFNSIWAHEVTVTQVGLALPTRFTEPTQRG